MHAPHDYSKAVGQDKTSLPAAPLVQFSQPRRNRNSGALFPPCLFARCTSPIFSLQTIGYVSAAGKSDRDTMALLVRIYFNAVFGALGGLIGWMLLGAFLDPTMPNLAQWLVGGGLIG